MKNILLVWMCALAASCSSSEDTLIDPQHELIGTWLSNCHEFLGTEDETGNTLYNISELTITETEYVDNYTSYTDINCTQDPVEESGSFSYSVGDMVTTTDGVSATRITLIPIFPDRPELEISFEAVYRISGVELNFGRYEDNTVPTIDVGITYLKQ